MQGLLICTVFLVIWKALDKVVEMYNLYLSAKVNMKEMDIKGREPEIEVQPEVRQIGFSIRNDDEEYEED